MQLFKKVSFSGLGAILLTAPRVLVPLGMFAAGASCLTGCVSRIAYEEATSAAEVEREGHRRAELEVATLKARISELQSELNARSEGLEARDQRLAEEKFEHNVASKERDETASLVAQLRGELARANEHLESYARNNARLEHELSVTREGGGPSPLMQELKTLVQNAHLEQSVRFTENASGVSASVPADVIWKHGEAELGPALSPLSTALATFAAAHPELRVVMREGAADPSLPESIGKQRRESLRALLAHPKLSSVVVYEAQSNGPAPASYELSLSFASGAR
jgi:hypothetical protein